MSFFRSMWKRENEKNEPARLEKSSEIQPKGRRFLDPSTQKYELCEELGHGGFGIVYKVNCINAQSILALKTFRDEFFKDMETRELFRREANIWIQLGRHPYLVRAYFVDDLESRLYIAMEYISPNAQGLNTLQNYLDYQPPNLAQSLRWAIQFCYGMEYANSMGVRCHRDIKPANIMIDQQKTLKITDFGLAGIFDTQKNAPLNALSFQHDKVGFSVSVFNGRGCGTPTHMPPEQFINAAECDQRSDIYAFGVVLYQMASRGRLPFLAALPRDGSIEEQARFGREMYLLHSQARAPKLDSPLFPLIQRCLEKQPHKRYQAFQELRADLEPLLVQETDERIVPPKMEEFTSVDWNLKGISLSSLGRYEEAIQCHEKALQMKPKSNRDWICMGSCFDAQGKYNGSIACYDKAIEIDPSRIEAWYNKGAALNRLNRYDEAIQCCDKALEINPEYAVALIHKGYALYKLGRFADALQCHEKALQINPADENAWYNKGIVEENLRHNAEALKSFRKYVELTAGINDGATKYAKRRVQELESL
jgi:serine/threonine protein kinase